MNCVFVDKSIKFCMLVDLKVFNNLGYRGIVEKFSNKYKLVLILKMLMLVFFLIVLGWII